MGGQRTAHPGPKLLCQINLAPRGSLERTGGEITLFTVRNHNCLKTVSLGQLVTQQ